MLSFESLETLSLLSSLDKPVLILQSKEDFQVRVDDEYLLYYHALSENENIEFRLYDDIHHMFMKSGGPYQYT